MDVLAPVYSQKELCAVAGLDTVTVDTWLNRGLLEKTPIGRRMLRGRRLFSTLSIFEAKTMAELVKELSMPASDASKVARCAAGDWGDPHDWKHGVVAGFDRSVNVARVFLLIAKKNDGWITIPVFAGKHGLPLFEPNVNYAKYMKQIVGILPASRFFDVRMQKMPRTRTVIHAKYE